MTKQIFLIVLVTLSFFFGTNNADAQTNLPPEICGRYAELNYSGTIPTGYTGYWIDSTNTVVNWWQVVNQTQGNGPNTTAEVGNYGQNAFAFVTTNGTEHDTTAWVTTVFMQKPTVDACPSCYRLENVTLDNVNGGYTVEIGSVRTDTICLYDNSSFYTLNPAFNIGQPKWSKSLNGIDFANGVPPVYNETQEAYDSVYVNIYNSDEANAVGDYYMLVFKSENGAGCADSDTLLVSFVKQPSATIEFRQPYCHGQDGLVWTAIDYEANPTSFNWDFGNNAIIDSTYIDVTTPDSVYSVSWGNNNDCDNLIHQIRLTASNDWGCVSSLNSVYVEEPGLPNPTFNSVQPDCGVANGIIRISHDSLIVCEDTINYAYLHEWINSTISGYDYQVDYGNNTIIDSLINVSSQDTSWLEFTYTSFITSDTSWVGPQFQCKDTIQIILDDCTFIFNYNNNEANINVYPNPTIESITIEVNNYQLIKNKEIITITNLTGKVVKSSILESSNFTLNVSELITGIYILKIGNTVSKFVKE